MANNYFGITDTGRLRSNNEDTFIAVPVANGKYIAACVIDGVGGYEGGEVAAEIARQTIMDHLDNLTADIIAGLRSAIAAANHKIIAQKQETRTNGQMACVVTVALADIEENKFYYAHVGDTRLYLLRDQSLVKVTKDHSFVGFLEDSGRLTEDAARKHPKRNEINKALGFDSEIGKNNEYIESGDSPFLPGDLLLLCSDGLTDMVSNSQITRELLQHESLANKAKALINQANQAGGKDNITVVLVWNNKTPIKQKATKPATTVKKSETGNSEQVNLSATPYHHDIRHPQTKKKGSSTVTLLVFLLVLLALALAWVLYRDFKRTRQANEVQQQQALQRNDQEQKLVDDIDNTTNGEVFILATPGQPITITDSILVHKDSMHVIGNGITLVSDTAYNGAAFIVSPDTRYFLLDSLTLQDFDIGLLMRSPGLHLRNVQFKNCKIPVQQELTIPANAVVNGRLTDSAFIFSPLTNNY